MARAFNQFLTRETVSVDAPTFLLALIVAEFFYKLHSFTLELICFALTWVALRAVVARSLRHLRRAPIIEHK